MTSSPLAEFPTPARFLGPVGRFLRASPVTASFVLLALLLFILPLVFHPGELHEGPRHWGAITTLSFFRQIDQDTWKNVTPELHGPFDLWKGEWWRLVVTGFHHGNILHLVLNLWGLSLLGPLAERQLGRLRYAVFFVAATIFSICAEQFWGNGVVGLSGGIFALLGFLVIRRLRDPQLAEELPDDHWIQYLFFCVVMAGLSALEIVAIGNTAHVAGLLFGVGAGVLFGQRKWSVAGGVLAAAVLVVAAGYFAIHPVWLGRYHWFLARQEGLESSVRTAHLRAAIDHDPRLPGAWLELSREQQADSRPIDAWRTLLEAILINRHSLELLDAAGEQWRRLVRLHLEPLATEVANETLGDESAAWLKRIDEAQSQASGRGEELPDEAESEWIFRIDPSPNRLFIERVAPQAPQPEKPSGLPDNTPDSAGEGISL